MAAPGSSQAFERAAARAAALFAGYEPPRFAHVPDPDAAIFLCAVDHRSGYSGRHLVDGEGPFEGSELMWAAGLRAARRRPGLLSAPGLIEVSGSDVAEAFRVDRQTVADPERRAALWRDLAAGLERHYVGRSEMLLAAAEEQLGGRGGLLDRLARFEAYADPLAKKSQLFAKICARRGWLEILDPQNWEVSADNVLMRLALRAGLVAPGNDLDRVRAETRAAFKRVAAETGIAPPLLDDLLWELGRDDSDLLGAETGALPEPERDPASAWY